MKQMKTKGKLSVIVMIALLVALLVPGACADVNSARSVSSLEELISVMNDPSSGSELEFNLADGDYTLSQSEPVQIPDGKTVTVYANSVTLRHQPSDGAPLFKVPYGAALNLIGTGSDPLTIVNTTPDAINAVLAAQQSTVEEQPVAEETPAEGETQPEGETGETPEAVPAEQTPGYTPVYNVTSARGIDNAGTLNLNNVAFKGFANEEGGDANRGYALVNTGSATLLNVTVKNSDGNDAPSSIRNEGSLEIAAGDERTQDSSVNAVSGDFYSRERRNNEAAAEQAAAEQAAAEAAAAEQANAVQAKVNEAAQYASAAEGYAAEADNVYSIAQERISQGAFSSELESPMNACNVSMNLATEMAKAAEAIRAEYPDNAEIAAAAEKARSHANHIAELYDSICNSYADILEQEAEMPEGTYLVQPVMVGMGAPSTETANTETENIVISGTGATESQQNVDVQGGTYQEQIENFVTAPTPAPTLAPTPTPYVTYTTPTPYTTTYTSTQDTSAKQSIVVNASWSDNNNSASLRPGSTQVSLYMNGGLYMNATLSAANNWTYTFQNLPVGNSYRIEETSVPNYATNYYTNGNTVSIAHTYNGPQTNATYNTATNYNTATTAAGGTAGAYSGTQTTTYNAQQTNQQTGTQTTGNNNVSVTPGPSSTPLPTLTPVPAYTSPTPSASQTAVPTATPELPETASRSASRGKVWIIVLAVSALAIVAIIIILVKVKKAREEAARARARARRKAEMAAQPNGGRVSTGAYMAQQARANNPRPNYPGQNQSAAGTASRPRPSSSGSLDDYAMSDGKPNRNRTATPNYSRSSDAAASAAGRTAAARPATDRDVEDEFRSSARAAAGSRTARPGYSTDRETQFEVADAVRKAKTEEKKKNNDVFFTF